MVKNRKGVQGARIKIEPEKVESMLATSEIIQQGKVIKAGNQSICKVGDTVIVSDWLVERIKIGEETSYYVNDSSILEIL